MQYVKLSCGKHSGLRNPEENRQCRKCQHFDKQSTRAFRKGLQYSGIPFIAALGEPTNTRKPFSG